MNDVYYLSLHTVKWERSFIALLLFSTDDKPGCCIYKQLQCQKKEKKQRGRSGSSLVALHS